MIYFGCCQLPIGELGPLLLFSTGKIGDANSRGCYFLTSFGTRVSEYFSAFIKVGDKFFFKPKSVLAALDLEFLLVLKCFFGDAGAGSSSF